MPYMFLYPLTAASRLLAALNTHYMAFGLLQGGGYKHAKIMVGPFSAGEILGAGPNQICSTYVVWSTTPIFEVPRNPPSTPL